MSRKSAVYLHQQQREFIAGLARSWLWRTELPTWLLIITIYGGWFTTVAWWQSIGLFPAILLLIWLSTWYMSLQHELLHGHPTRFPRLNQLFGLLPFSVWYPYGTYRDLHLKHHYDEDLTVPETDPESYYFTERRWQHFNGIQRLLVRLRNTFPGRLLLTPLLTIPWVVIDIWQSFRSVNRLAMVMWSLHIALLIPVFFWLQIHNFSIIYYLLLVTWPMLALTRVRSFFEHRAAEDPEARTVINEAGLFWRLLFLNLNYHSVHHDLPAIPWYGLPKVYRAYKQEYLKRNQGFFVNGYGELMREHLLKPIKVEINPYFPEGRVIPDPAIAKKRMTKLLSLPMYDVCHPDTEALLKILRQLLTEEGLEDNSLLYQQSEDRLAHWQDSALLLSQTCGYPLRTLLPEVQVVGTFHYQAAGCDNFHYSSHLVVRAADVGKILADFRDRRVVCNSEDSQSGYHCLRTLVAPLHHNGRFFSQLLFSGSHQNSLAALIADQADIAAIDAVTWALVSQHQPERTAGLVSLGTTPLIPGLPMITSAQTSAETLAKLRQALTRLVTEPEWHHVCNALLIKGFSVTGREDYQLISDNEVQAANSGLLGL